MKSNYEIDQNSPEYIAFVKLMQTMNSSGMNAAAAAQTMTTWPTGGAVSIDKLMEPKPEEPEGSDMLKPCPCCNNPADYEKMGSMCYVKCAHCGLKTELVESEKECRRKWNNRHEENKFDKEMSDAARTNEILVSRLQTLKKMVDEDVTTIGQYIFQHKSKLGAKAGEATLNIAASFLKFSLDRVTKEQLAEFIAFREKVKAANKQNAGIIASNPQVFTADDEDQSEEAVASETPF
jgi:hypothetical protein